jgi:hypothetical protein
MPRPSERWRAEREAAALDAGVRLRALWSELAGIYDAIESRLPTNADGIDTLTARMAELTVMIEGELATLRTLRAELRPESPRLTAYCRETDATIATLAERLPNVMAAAVAARRVTAARLAHVCTGRTQARGYDALGTVPFFASRRV